MHNKLYDSITTTSKFFITAFIVLIFIISKSIYIMLFAPLLVIYLLLVNSEKLDKYFRLLKNYLIILLLMLIIILIVTGLNLIIILKYVVIVMLIALFILDLNFENTNGLIYKIIRSKYISYKITLFLYYINTIFMSKDEIRNFQAETGYIQRKGIFTRLEYAKYKRDKLDNNFKNSFYTIKLERVNFISLFLFAFFLFLFIIVLIRK